MSGQTLVERILSEKSGRDVRAGDIVIAKVDLAYVQDGTGPLTFRQMEAMGLAKAANPSRTVVFIDHASPPPRKELATDHVYLRDFGGKLGAVISDIGGGVCHQVAFEWYVRPGDVVIGADSHTVMGGAMGAFASGMGSTDVAVAIGLGKTWLRVPETIRFDVKGAFPKGVYSKDLILKVIGDIKTDGATYQSMEWGGPAVHAMPMTERMVLSNMAIEAGGKCGPIPSDEETKRYLKAHKREKDWKPLKPDSDAEYEREVEVDVKELEPMVARPPQEDNVVPVTDPSVKGLRIQQVYLGSCTNARFEDIKVFCDILKGEKVASGTRLIVTPASKESYEKSLKAGLFDVLLDAGAMINSPGCAACPGVHGGIPGDGENVLSTTNRNYVGRMGNPAAFTYLASPATAAATTIYGVITDPREVV
ncbi:MAG TPA: 3-isopropylmalate dehydratase large subunit [Thermoplasmata archaeon]